MKQIVAIKPNGHHAFYRSITEFREEYKVSCVTLNRALKSGEAIKRGKLKGWKFYYYDPMQEVLDTSDKAE